MLRFQHKHALRLCALIAALVMGLVSSPARADHRAPASGLVVSVYDSLHKRPLDGAIVSVMQEGRIAAEATTAANGEVSFTDIAPGTYSIVAFHDALTRLDQGLRKDSVEISADKVARVALRIPDARGMVRTLCGSSVDSSTAAITGVVNYGASAAEDAQITAEWLTPGGSDSAAIRTPTSVSVQSITDGRFLVCGVPVGVTAMVTIRHSGNARSGGILIARSQPFMSVTAQISRASSPRFLTLLEPSADSVTKARSTRLPVRGVVIGQNGAPLDNVSVQAGQAAQSAVSNAKGEFSVTGDVNADLVLFARRAGFEAAEVHVPLASLSDGQSPDVVVILHDNSTTLSAVTVAASAEVATRLDTALKKVGFTDRKRYRPGEFQMPEKIAEKRPMRFIDLFRMSTAVRIDGNWIRSTRYNKYQVPVCLAVFVDGVERLDAEVFMDGIVKDIAVLEVYTANNTPEMFQRTVELERCTTILVWTHTHLGTEKPKLGG